MPTGIPTKKSVLVLSSIVTYVFPPDLDPLFSSFLSERGDVFQSPKLSFSRFDS